MQCDTEQPLQVTTTGESPGGAPVDVDVTPLTSNSVRVDWTPPDPAQHHGDLLAYHVGYKIKE